MVADKLYFEVKVKDDLSRFLRNEGVLPAVLKNTRRRSDDVC